MKLKRSAMRERSAGFNCTQQLVGVNKSEHATLSAHTERKRGRKGWKKLAVNREAGYVPVLSGDRGSSSMWDSHHLASFTPISPEDQPRPRLERVHVFMCAERETV